MMQDVNLESKYLTVLDRRMSYLEIGEGAPVLFLHGNPTSSFLWRNILPKVAKKGRRLIALDLIGMGKSEKLLDNDVNRYRFTEHRKFLDAFINELGICDNLTIVGHDWGGVLMFDWAYRHPFNICGLGYMETIVRPLTSEDIPASILSRLSNLRSNEGEDSVLINNEFFEEIFTKATLQPLCDKDLEQYRAPFAEPGEGRRPTLAWPREIPIDGEPSDMNSIIESYSEWIAHCDVPKLFIDADQGVLISGQTRKFCDTLNQQRKVTVSAAHYVPEDAPVEVAAALNDWLDDLPTRQEERLSDSEWVYLTWHHMAHARDVEGLANLYSQDAILESPLIPAVLNDQNEGVLRGKENIFRFLDEGTRRRPNPLVRWYRNDKFFTNGNTLIWEYPREIPEGEQVDILEVMDLDGRKIRHHRIYWGWKGVNLISGAVAKNLEAAK